MPHPKHNEVRARFHARCGYCGVDEANTAGDLTVDHYQPVVAGGDDSDANLVYACFRCNLYKGDFHPSAEDRGEGLIILHPLRDDAREHMRLDESTGLLDPLTTTGRFHIAILHLNRPALVAYRLGQRHRELLMARRELLEAELRELRDILQAQQTYINHLKRLLADRTGDG